MYSEKTNSVIENYLKTWIERWDIIMMSILYNLTTLVSFNSMVQCDIFIS